MLVPAQRRPVLAGPAARDAAVHPRHDRFAFVVTWWAGALGGVTTILWDWTIPRPPDNKDLNELLGFGSGDDVPDPALHGHRRHLRADPAAGRPGRGAAGGAVRPGAANGVDELREQVAEAEAGRDAARAQREAAVSAEATALRRLERDIHDGPQQRLVRLAMDLGRAEQQFESDPQAARATVVEALTQTRETLDELRALSRGIAPPILVDRGLRGRAGRARRPVAGPGRPGAARRSTTGSRTSLETTTYFVVAEALTNVAKHSGAEECRVSCSAPPTALLVTIEDDGVGGASLAKGHGLAGLADRIKAAGGEMTVTSPTGGGTRLTAILPT